MERILVCLGRLDGWLDSFHNVEKNSSDRTCNRPLLCFLARLLSMCNLCI